MRDREEQGQRKMEEGNIFWIDTDTETGKSRDSDEPERFAGRPTAVSACVVQAMTTARDDHVCV